MIVHIIAYNLLTPLRQLVADLRRFDGVDGITIIDHDSSYPPLLEWYETCGCKVIHGKNDRGSKGAFRHVDNSDWHVVTDCDLDMSTVPTDALVQLRAVLEDHPKITKAGLSLELGDLPRTPMCDLVRTWELNFWTERFPEDSRFWVADIDTTLAVYRPKATWGGYGPALRFDRPYTARHTPWYWDLEHLTDEQRHYLSQTIRGTWWTGKVKRATKL